MKDTSHIICLDDGYSKVLHTHCQKCKDSLLTNLPVPIDEMVTSIMRFIKKHKNCGKIDNIKLSNKNWDCFDDITAPIRWRKKCRIAVNPSIDLFYEQVPDEFLVNIFNVIRNCHADCKGHTFQFLTKYPKRMRDVMRRLRFDALGNGGLGKVWIADNDNDSGYPLGAGHLGSSGLDNVWVGVSCEDQVTADEHIPLLLETPAAVRFLSCEPLLGPIDLQGSAPSRDGSGVVANWLEGLDWVVVGGETGPSALPCDVSWVSSIVKQCAETEVPCFVKRLGSQTMMRADSIEGRRAGDHPERDWPFGTRFGTSPGGMGTRYQGHRAFLLSHDGSDPSEWPEHLRVRELPR